MEGSIPQEANSLRSALPLDLGEDQIHVGPGQVCVKDVRILAELHEVRLRVRIRRWALRVSVVAQEEDKKEVKPPSPVLPVPPLP